MEQRFYCLEFLDGLVISHFLPVSLNWMVHVMWWYSFCAVCRCIHTNFFSWKFFLNNYLVIHKVFRSWIVSLSCIFWSYMYESILIWLLKLRAVCLNILTCQHQRMETSRQHVNIDANFVITCLRNLCSLSVTENS